MKKKDYGLFKSSQVISRTCGILACGKLWAADSRLEQAAQVARVPLTEMLYVLNLTLGEDEERLSQELAASDINDLDVHETSLRSNPMRSPILMIWINDLTTST